MKYNFGTLKNGEPAYLYEISWGPIKAQITNYGATLVRLFVPDKNGRLADVVLGFDSAGAYDHRSGSFGAVIGRNANRIRKGSFQIGGKTVQMPINNKSNNLHSGPEHYGYRLWKLEKHKKNSVRFSLFSLDGDQGLPGNAEIHVTYTLEAPGALRITYDGISDQDTVFNMTNHAYFNMAGHDKPEKAMSQTLILPARFYTPSDEESIPTGELCPVAGTPMDFRSPKPIGRDLSEDYFSLKLQGGYDHNYEVFTDPCAILIDEESGRSVAVTTDCPGIQVYSGNFMNDIPGKDGVCYCHRGGVALETQYYPDSVNHPQWPQPRYQAGEHYHSETLYTFKW